MTPQTQLSQEDAAVAESSPVARPIDPEARPEPSAANFDRLVSVYRWMEWASFGPWLWWCRCAFLSESGERRRALIFGDGDGRFTARLLQVNQAIRVDAIDSSPAMLRSLLRSAGSAHARVNARAMDARMWRPWSTEPHSSGARGYDLVVSHFFLDCLTTEQVRSLAATVRSAVEPGAVWVVSEFAVPQGRFGRWIARPLVGMLYSAFGWLTGLKVRDLPDHRSALKGAGFSLLKTHSWLRGLLVSELWTAAGSAAGDSEDHEKAGSLSDLQPVSHCSNPAESMLQTC